MVAQAPIMCNRPPRRFAPPLLYQEGNPPKLLSVFSQRSDRIDA